MNVVELPSNHSPGLAKKVACRKEALSSAFLDLEPDLCDVAHMANIVAGLIAEAHSKDQVDEQSAWVVMHLCKMVSSLRDQYYRLDSLETSDE